MNRKLEIIRVAWNKCFLIMYIRFLKRKKDNEFESLCKEENKEKNRKQFEKNNEFFKVIFQ